MPSREEAQLIAAGVVAGMFADNVTVGGTPVYLGVYPRNITADVQAETYMIRSVTTDIHLAFNAVPGTSGIHSARLFADTDYILPLGPKIHTLGFLSAAGNSALTQVHVRAVVQR